MILTTYHTHSDLCDGKGELAEYVRSAVRKGFKAFGFSGHSPLPYPDTWTLQDNDVAEYLRKVRQLKEEAPEQYKGVELYLGMEVDYIEGGPGYRRGPGGPELPMPGLAPDSAHILDLGLDYVIGSVHTAAPSPGGSLPGVDGPYEMFVQTLEETFGGDIQALVKEYYRLVRKMTAEHRFDILAHIDLIKLRNAGDRYFRESDEWYRKELFSVLDALEANGAVLEINTGGLARGKCHDMYPSLWILEEAHKREIPIQINSDAHHPDGIDAYFGAAAERARRAGYSQQRVLLGGEWHNVPLDIPASCGMPGGAAAGPLR